MKVLQELTEWEVEYDMKNHIYFTNDSKDKMYAYIKSGTMDVFKFKVPIKFSTSRRKFKEIPNTFGYDYQEERSKGQTWQVAGSRGDSYTVTKEGDNWSCTCAGFKFRSQCKHIDSFKSV